MADAEPIDIHARTELQAALDQAESYRLTIERLVFLHQMKDSTHPTEGYFYARMYPVAWRDAYAQVDKEWTGEPHGD